MTKILQRLCVTKHDKGCAPCISKNLRLREVPNCFFNLTENADKRTGDTFEDFSKLVLGKKEPLI